MLSMRSLAAILLLAIAVPQADWCVQESSPTAPDAAVIDDYVEHQMREHRIPGVALAVIEGGEIVLLRGYGVADTLDRPMTAQTLMLIGSMSKSFTALAAAFVAGLLALVFCLEAVAQPVFMSRTMAAQGSAQRPSETDRADRGMPARAPGRGTA
jgi:hypothetical protein